MLAQSVEDLPIELQLKIFSELNVTDLCSCALVNKAWYSVCINNVLWNRFPQRVRRKLMGNYPSIKFWNFLSVYWLLKLSMMPQDIQAYDFFHCKCSKEHRIYNKRWFGHKTRRRRCDCPTVNNRLGWLVVFLLCMEYLLFFSASIGAIWDLTNSTSTPHIKYETAARSSLFAVFCTSFILFLVLALKWYISKPLYRAFFVFASSLLISASQHVSLLYQAYATLCSLTLLYHLLSSKTDHGYRYQLLVEMVIFHCIVKAQWIIFQVPVYLLPVISAVMLPLTLKLDFKVDHGLALFVLGIYNFFWLTSLGTIQHLQIYLDIVIPQALTRDFQFWLKVLFMPIVCMQVFLNLDSTDQQARMLGVTLLQRYAHKLSHMVVFWLNIILVLMSLYQVVPVVALVLRLLGWFE